MKHARDDYSRIQDPENKIPEDEPVFLLRGQDKLAPMILLRYASDLEEAGGDSKMVTAVRGQAAAMYAWQAIRASKLPDL